MFAVKMHKPTTKSMLVLAITVCVVASCALATSEQKTEENSRVRMVSPFSLARMFAPFGPAGQSGDLPAQSFKRSSSLDPLSGIIIGKRNGPASLQLDPWYSMRHSNARLLPRFVYDLQALQSDDSEY